MKIVRFAAGNQTRYGMLSDEDIRVLSAPPFESLEATGIRHQLRDVRILAPCVPSKIVAVGLNYRSHAREVGASIPETPLLFLKPSSAVIGPEDDIAYPKASRRVDYEGALGVVIGREAWRVPAAEALDHVLGYTCFNDVTARDLQSSDGQWTRAKGFNTFAPFGPCIETELDPADVPVRTLLNGEVRQDGNTSDLIYSVAEVIAFVSGIMTLLPGDVIATGTPGGIGPMSPGDVVEVTIPPVGTLRNRLVG